MPFMDKNNVKQFPFTGDIKPVKVMQGNTVLFEPITSEKSGVGNVSFGKCYNDTADVVLKGNIQLMPVDYKQSLGISTQSGTPTLDNPIYPTPSVVVGNYKVPCTSPRGGYWEFTLPFDLNGIGTYQDRPVIDAYNGYGFFEQNINKLVFTGNESSWVYGSNAFSYLLANAAIGNSSALLTICSHFLNYTWAYLYSNTVDGAACSGVYLRFRTADGNTDVAAFKALLAAQNAKGTPVTSWYVLATPIRTPLVLAWVASSSYPDLPSFTSLTTTPSALYPAPVKGVGVYNSVTGLYDYTGWSHGKNLIDFEKWLSDSGTSYTVVDGAYYFQPQTAMYTTGFDCSKLDINYYTISFDAKLGTASNFRFEFIYTDGTFKSTSLVISAASYVHFTTTCSNTKKLSKIRVNWTTYGTVYIENIRLVRGSSEVPYEPYHNDTVTFSLPHPLNDIDGAKDEYAVNTGKDTKRCSDLIVLDSSKIVGVTEVPNSNGVRKIYTDAIYPSTGNAKGYKFDSTPLGNGTVNADCCAAIDSRLYITASPIDTGWSAVLPVSVAEAKAYCNGWKMCHSDGMSPYYKSEIPYTSTTWAEWIKSGNVMADSTGITLTVLDTYVAIRIPTQIKPSTKYGILLNVVSNTLTKYIVTEASAFDIGQNVIPPLTTGNIKTVLTSASSITTNAFWIKRSGNELETKSIKIKDIRIYELPIGSQIESDFNTMTADTFSTKYPFYGLCVPYWKRIVDGAGLTSTLPTASYVGWTPYRMIYELATSITTTYPSQAQDPKTFYPSTDIVACEESEVKPTIEVTARQIGI